MGHRLSKTSGEKDSLKGKKGPFTKGGQGGSGNSLADHRCPGLERGSRNVGGLVKTF